MASHFIIYFYQCSRLLAVIFILKALGWRFLQGHSWDSFDVVRDRVAAEWAALPKTADVISTSLRALQAQVRQEHFGRDRLASLHAK